MEDSSASLLDSLPTELKEAVLDQCDYGSLIALLQTSKSWYNLSLLRTKNTERRVQFLIDYETSPENARATLYPGVKAHSYWAESLNKRLYVCFTCLKMKPFEAFASGQICGMRFTRQEYLRFRRSFCLDCGMKREPIRYLAGAMVKLGINNIQYLLCGKCRRWREWESGYCMNEKICKECTESSLCQDCAWSITGCRNCGAKWHAHSRRYKEGLMERA